MKWLEGLPKVPMAEIIFKGLFMVLWLWVINKYVFPLDMHGILLIVLGYVIGTFMFNGIRIKRWYDRMGS